MLGAACRSRRGGDASIAEVPEDHAAPDEPEDETPDSDEDADGDQDGAEDETPDEPTV